MAVHIPIAGLALLPPLLGWPALLAPIHIVLLEMVIDPTCSIVFELEPADADVMKPRPRGRGEHLFETRRIVFAVVLGLGALLGPLAVVAFARMSGAGDAMVRTLGFVALITSDLALVAASRGTPRRGARAERNPAARCMAAVVVGVVALVVVVPWRRRLFAFAMADAVARGGGPGGYDPRARARRSRSPGGEHDAARRELTARGAGRFLSASKRGLRAGILVAF